MTTIYTASLNFEGSTFSSIPTGRSAFSGRDWDKGQTLAENTQLGTIRSEARNRGWTVVEGPHSRAMPGGRIVGSVYQSIRKTMLDELANAGPVDAILLYLHGASVAEGEDDVSGDLLAAMRVLVGDDVPIFVEVDLHLLLTARMMNNATAIIGFKEYPHTDMLDRAVDLVVLADKVLKGEVKPVMGWFDCRMMAGCYYTKGQPLRGFVDRMYELEASGEVLSVTFAHGMDEADVPGNGAKMLVITDNDPDKAAELAEKLGREIYAMRTEIQPAFLTPCQAVEEAFSQRSLAIIADASDNPGAGHPGDGTHILRAIIDRGPLDRQVAVMIHDPQVFGFAQEVGVRSALKIRIGGKTSWGFGDPVDLETQVEALSDTIVQKFPQGDKTPVFVESGGGARLRCGNLHVIVTERRVQANGLEFFTDLGLKFEDLGVVAVKSQQHYYAAFRHVGKRFIDSWHIGKEGDLNPYAGLTFHNIPRPCWPWDADPFGDQ